MAFLWEKISAIEDSRQPRKVDFITVKGQHNWRGTGLRRYSWPLPVTGDNSASASDSSSLEFVRYTNFVIIIIIIIIISYCRETALQGGLVMAKSGRLELGGQYFTDTFTFQSLWRNWPAKQSNSVKKRKIRAIMTFKVIQGHRGRYQSKARMRLPISD